MGIASQLFDDQSQLGRETSISENSAGEKIRFCVENLWIVMMFILFIALGPFAAIAVVPAVISLARQHGDAPMPDSVESKA